VRYKSLSRNAHEGGWFLASRWNLGEKRGFDAGKKIIGRKRHAMVDMDGRALVLHVHPASVQEAVVPGAGRSA
jgi:hypothetical protein